MEILTFMRQAVAALFIWTSFAAIAHGQALEFKGVPMGATVAEFKSSLPEIELLNCGNVDDSGNGYCSSSSGGITYADQTVTWISAEFLDGGLAQVSVGTLGGTGKIIEEALANKYGRPKHRSKVPQTLKNGSTYKMSVTEWRVRNGGMISIEDHPAPHNKVYTSLTSAAWLAWQAKAGKAGPKAKKDI